RAQKAGSSVSYAQGNANYRSLSALPAGQFTPAGGTGNGWTATYYPGSSASGTPLGSETVSSLDVTSTPAIVTNAGVSTSSATYTPTFTPAAPGTAEFGLAAGGNATLSVGGRQVVSYGPNTGSTFTGLTDLTAGHAVPFAVTVTGIGGSSANF